MAKVSSPTRSRYSWDPNVQRYRGPSGRYVSQKAFRQSFNSHIRKARREVERLAEQVSRGAISIPEWQRQMVNAVKTIRLQSAAAARGGWAQMTKADFGKVGQQLRAEYKFLRKFAKDIRGKKLAPGTIRARAGSYVSAGASAYENTRRDAAAEIFTEERNILGHAEHCHDNPKKGSVGCIEQTARGWVKVGTLVPIGRRTCRVNCRCRYSFR